MEPDAPAAMIMRSPPASGFSSASTCARDTSRTSTHAFEPSSSSFDFGVVDVIVSTHSWRDVFSSVIELTSWIAG